MTVPAQTWKVALVLPKGDDDVSRVNASVRTIAVIMPNTQGIRTNDPSDWRKYLVSVDQVEALTGYDFFSNVPDAVENSIEAGVDGVNPPGTEGQSVTTDEDTPKAITLTAVSANNNTLTYTIISPPTRGTLTGVGADRTYTPALNFNGTDSFTFRVNDGLSNSNVSTVTITVNEINDAPTLAPIGDQTVVLGDELTFTAIGSDVDVPAQILSYSLTGAVPAGATINSATGVFTWTPTAAQAGQLYTFGVRVSDGGLFAEEQINVAVVDRTPPVITGVAVDKPVLSPPNHKMVDVTVSYNVTDNSGSVSSALSVTSNEPINGTGDGNTSFDWEIVDDHTVRLRAERSGNGNGRIYTITITATDNAGNSTSQQVTVSVPKGRS